jgi:hypothetical protein
LVFFLFLERRLDGNDREKLLAWERRGAEDATEMGNCVDPSASANSMDHGEPGEYTNREVGAMALEEFLTNVSASLGPLAPAMIADAPRLDTALFEAALRKEGHWLAPKTVQGFDPADVDFLPPRELQSLTDSVERFRDVARQVPADTAATGEQIQRALPEFLRILEIVRPDKYADAEALEVGKQVEAKLAGRLPPAIWELRFETDEDSSGDDAVWIWVVLKDDAARKDVFQTNVRSIRRLLTDAVTELGIKQWPYVHFRTDSELKQMNSRVAP